MAKFIKNNTNETKTWCGQEIASGEYYEIQDVEIVSWSSNSTLLTAIATADAIVSKTNSSSGNITDVNLAINYLKDISSSVDNDGSNIIRVKAARAGWVYHLTGMEFTTSTLNSLYHKDVAGNALSEASVKFYDSNNIELITQGTCDTDCVKTVFTFEPTWDYEIIGGTIKTVSSVTEDTRVWVIAVPDVPANMGGSKVMVQSVNLRYIDPNNGIEADGRASKYMAYSATYHTNKLQMTVKHSAGYKLGIMIAFEVYRE